MAICFNNYGAFLCELGQYEAAQRQFRAAGRSSEPGAKADSFDNSGYCYLKAQKMAEARKALIQAVTEDVGKGPPMLLEASQRIQQGKYAQARLLLDVYELCVPLTAESLWLEIRFAALEGRSDDLKSYATQTSAKFSTIVTVPAIFSQ